METDSRIPFTTPREVRELNLILTGQAMVENQEAWVHVRIERVSRMWTDPLAPVGVLPREPDRQVALLVLGLQSTVGTSTPRAAWPRLCDVSGDAPRAVADEVNQVTARDTNMAVAQVEATKTPSEDACRDPPLSGNAASGPTPSTGPRRRRRGGRRRRKSTLLPPSVAGGGGGGDDSRGVQASPPPSEFDAAEHADREAGGPWLPRIREEDPGRALLAAESPKHDQNKVRPSAYKVQRRGIVVSCAQSGWECGQDSMDCTPKSLSQRREFLGVAANEAGSATLLTELRVTTSRGQKGRQVVEKDALAGQCQMLPTVARHPRPGTREMAGIAAALACRGRTGIVSARFTWAASRRYYGLYSPALWGHRRRHRHRRRQRIDGHSHSGDTRQLTGTQRAEPHYCRGCCNTASVTRTEGAGRENAAAGRTEVGGWNRTLQPSLTVDTSPGTADSSCSLPATEEREVEAATISSDGLEEGLEEDTGTPLAAMVNGESATGTDDKPRLGPEEGGRPPELPSVPQSVQAWLMGGGVRIPLEIKWEDWSMMESVGFGSHAALAVAFAWRRCSDPSTGRDRNSRPRIKLMSAEALEMPTDAWPTSWEGLVEHAENGGYFSIAGSLRGGMDPAVAQQQLSLVDFNGPIDWDDIDRNLTRVRAGEVIPGNELTDSMRLAQLLSGCTALRQWDALAAFLAAQPQEVRAGLIISPARLAALQIEASRLRQEQREPPQWLLSASFAQLRFNHLSPRDFVPGPCRTNDLRGQIEDGIVNRLLSVAPEIKNHPKYRLQNLREDMRIELNPKDPGVETCLFSASVVLPTGPWLSEFYKGSKSLGGSSFCTISPIDLFVETELSNTDQQVLRAIRSALGVDNTAFRLILDAALSKGFRCEVRSRDDTVRFTSTGGKGGKRTMEHVSPDSSESRMLATMDATSLLLARRVTTTLPLMLGPVIVSITLMQCPHQALRDALQPREPAAIRMRTQGTEISCPVLLMGPLPKGSIPTLTVKSAAGMAELRHHMLDVCQNELQTKDVRFVGRYDKDRSPMFLYMEFGSVDEARTFGLITDRLVPPEFGKLLRSLWGDKALQMPFWSCNLLAECLATADEKTFKALMAQGQANPCPLPPPAPPPPPPPPPGLGGGQDIDGTGSAASGPDNPQNVQH